MRHIIGVDCTCPLLTVALGNFPFRGRFKQQTSLQECWMRFSLEHGPVEEMLMDNSAAFCSEVLWETLGRSNIRWYNRAAYRPSGNGIVEWNQTIKAISAFYNPYEMKGKVHLSSDMVKLFDGEGDLMACLAKVKLVARLQKIPDLASFISLFLGYFSENGAFVCSSTII